MPILLEEELPADSASEGINWVPGSFGVMLHALFSEPSGDKVFAIVVRHPEQLSLFFVASFRLQPTDKRVIVEGFAHGISKGNIPRAIKRLGLPTIRDRWKRALHGGEFDKFVDFLVTGQLPAEVILSSEV